MLVFFPIYYVVYLIVKKPLYYKNYEAKEAQNSYYNTLNDQFSFMEDIKISANDKYNNFYMNEAYKEYENKYMNYIKVSGKFLSLDGVISVGFQVITFLYGGWKTLNGDMSVGELTIICTYFSMALQLIKYYFELGKSYQSVLASLNRINEIFLIKTENEGTEEVIQIQKIVGRISFKYEDDAPLLDDLNILLEPGKVYCIIGENGSGKSTISKILIGLLRIDSIDINGINIKDINMKRLRNEKIVYISQALNYPNRTIQEVYCEYKENIELQDVLNEIYKMKLSEERNIVELYENNWYRNVNALSGGEKQIITILKCIIKEADFIIFDEPTSNLDVNRTAILIETIKYIKSKGKIILIVTHDQALIDIGNSTIDLGKK